MELQPVSGSPTSRTPAVTSPSAASEISSDFETFLRMLTVQLQNQDPLNPVDSADYAVQLATFSGVEQQVLTNDLLRDLTATMGAAGLSDMAGWVGMEARSTAALTFDGTPLILAPMVDLGADRAELVVRDDQGNEVQRLPIGVSDATVSWAGVTADGAPLPSGTYSFAVASYAQGQALGEAPLETYQRVSEVQMQDGQPKLILAGGVTIAANEITALREPGS